MPTLTPRTRMKKVIAGLAKLYPEVACALGFEDAWQCLAATILSAQCTDKKVNEVTPALFAKYPDMDTFARAQTPSVERIIRPIGLYRGKAKNLIASAKRIRDDFAGVVPKTIDELVTLPGVGRKTANCVLVNAYDLPGIMVDTHCIRVSRRLGLHEEENPEAIELILKGLAPEDEWSRFSHRIIIHGRQVCNARKPRCEDCGLRRVCVYGSAV